jgi:hypothetical protein
MLLGKVSTRTVTICPVAMPSFPMPSLLSLDLRIWKRPLVAGTMVSNSTVGRRVREPLAAPPPEWSAPPTAAKVVPLGRPVSMEGAGWPWTDSYTRRP